MRYKDFWHWNDNDYDEGIWPGIVIVCASELVCPWKKVLYL